MNFYFVNTADAAVELNLRETQRRWTPSQVLLEAKAGRLPVCFEFLGELVVSSVDGMYAPAGVSPRVLDFNGVVRSLTPPSADGVCGFGVLVEIQEAYSIKFSRVDGKRTRGIDLPTEFSHGGRIKAGHVVKCWLEEADVPAEAFLFRNDDLASLVQTPAALATPAPETQPAPQPIQTDPERRLARLRDLGGNVKPKNGEYKFTGIARLVEAEKRDGRKRSDEKTIRSDLRAAAEGESEAKRAGPFDGLGHRGR